MNQKLVIKRVKLDRLHRWFSAYLLQCTALITGPLLLQVHIGNLMLANELWKNLRRRTLANQQGYVQFQQLVLQILQTLEQKLCAESARAREAVAVGAEELRIKTIECNKRVIHALISAGLCERLIIARTQIVQKPDQFHFASFDSLRRCRRQRSLQ